MSEGEQREVGLDVCALTGKYQTLVSQIRPERDKFLSMSDSYFIFPAQFLTSQLAQCTTLVIFVVTLCRFPLESPRKAMVCPALTLTATAVRRADGLSNMVSVSTAILLAIGLGVWSEPQG